LSAQFLAIPPETPQLPYSERQEFERAFPNATTIYALSEEHGCFTLPGDRKGRRIERKVPVSRNEDIHPTPVVAPRFSPERPTRILAKFQHFNGCT
jgi:hypothetical protein